MILYRNEKQKQKNLGILRALLLDTSPKCAFFSHSNQEFLVFRDSGKSLSFLNHIGCKPWPS